MMQFETNKGIVYITVGNSLYTLPETLEGFLENDELISKLSIKEILELHRMHLGIPNNFKDYLVKKAALYGDSPEASGFICEDKVVKLDKQQRGSIKNLLIIDPTMEGTNKFKLVLHNEIHEIEVSKVLDLLSKLEINAYKCLITTTEHLQNIDKLRTLDEILNYDYTTGYPEKLILK